MKYIVLVVLTYGALVLETSWPRLAPDVNLHLQLMPLLLLLIAIWLKPVQAVFWAGGIGLSGDALTTGPLGFEMASAITGMLLLQQLNVLPEQESMRGQHTKPVSLPVLAILCLGVAFWMPCSSAVMHLLWQQQPQLMSVQLLQIVPSCFCSAFLGSALWIVCRGFRPPASLNSY